MNPTHQTYTMYEVVVMSGCSGSGKSTYARKYIEEVFNRTGEHSAIVSADDYFMNNSGEYVFNPAKLNLAHGNCFGKFIQALVEDKAPLVIVDNTNTTSEEIAPYMLGAVAFGYNARIMTIDSSGPYLEKYIARNIHRVDANIILAQAKRIHERKLPQYWSRSIVIPDF